MKTYTITMSDKQRQYVMDALTIASEGGPDEAQALIEAVQDQIEAQS